MYICNCLTVQKGKPKYKCVLFKKVTHCWERQQTHPRHILCPFRMRKSTNIRLLENHELKSYFKFSNNLNSALFEQWSDNHTTSLSHSFLKTVQKEKLCVFSLLRLALVWKGTPHLLNSTTISPLSSHPFILMQMCNGTLLLFPISLYMISSFCTDKLYNKKTCKMTTPTLLLQRAKM